MRRGEGLPIDGRIAAAFRCLVLTLTLMLAGPLFAAGFTCAPKAESVLAGEQDEAEEVSSSARETVSSPKLMQAWLRRLPGRYTYDGYVDLCGKGNPAGRRPVKGRADCIAVSAAPDVHCSVNVTWPAARKEDGTPVLGGVTNLAPAQLLFSIEIPSPVIPIYRGAGMNGWGVVLEQVDNKGIGDFASGILVGDTFLATEPCVDMKGNCRKITRITAKPDDSEISMTVEVAMDRQRVLRQVFLMRRQPDVRKGQ
jgi:hypothetical protein